MKKKLLWIFFLVLSSGYLFSQEIEKADIREKHETPVKTEKQDEKKLEIEIRAQVQANAGQEKSGYAQTVDFDTLDFNFKRLRLNTKWEAAQWVGTVFNIRGENLIKLGSSTSPITYIGGIQEANIWFKPGFLGSQIKIGQAKIPFLREQLTSSANFVALDRGYSSKIIQLEDLGLFVQFQPLELISKDWAKKLDLAFSITNGDGSGIEGVGVKNGEVISKNNYIAKLYNWRVQINPFGGILKDGKETSWKDGEEIFQGNTILWSLGAAGAHSARSEFGAIGGVTGLDADGNKTYLLSTGKAYNGFTFDTTFFAYGIYVNGEFTTFSGDAVPQGYNTYQATLGYNIKLGSVYLLPLVRYNYQEWDKNGNGRIGESEKENSLWIGADLFAIKHDLKFQVFYNLVNNATGNILNKDVLYFQVSTNIGKKV